MDTMTHDDRAAARLADANNRLQVADGAAQAALMAPTEVLARQHMKTLMPIAENTL